MDQTNPQDPTQTAPSQQSATGKDSQEHTRRGRIRTKGIGVSREWQNFGASLLALLILPLLPLWMEAWHTETVSATTLTLTASTYAITLAFSTRNKFILILCIIVCVTFAMDFGQLSNTVTSGALPVGNTAANGVHSVRWDKVAAGVAITIVFALHAVERFNRHVVEQAPFLEFFDRR